MADLGTLSFIQLPAGGLPPCRFGRRNGSAPIVPRRERSRDAQRPKREQKRNPPPSPRARRWAQCRLFKHFLGVFQARFRYILDGHALERRFFPLAYEMIS